VGCGELTAAAARSKLEALVHGPPYYPGWLVIIAVGMACASFGRLLGLDWAAFVPVFIAAALGRWLRRKSAACHLNVFVAAILAVQDALRVVLTIGTMGTGLAIPAMLLRATKVTRLQAI
jgi:uncharacterized membrane protein YjjP (DUF1212 family)